MSANKMLGLKQFDFNPVREDWFHQLVRLTDILEGRAEHPSVIEERRLALLARLTPITVTTSGIYTAVTTDMNASFSLGHRLTQRAFPLVATTGKRDGRPVQPVLCGGRYKCTSPGHHHPDGFVAATEEERVDRHAADFPWQVELQTEAEKDHRADQAAALYQYAVDLDARDKARRDPDRTKRHAAELEAERARAHAVYSPLSRDNPGGWVPMGYRMPELELPPPSQQQATPPHNNPAAAPVAPRKKRKRNPKR